MCSKYWRFFFCFRPLNGGTPKTTEETLNSSNNGKPVVPPPLSTSASGTTHLPASNQKTLPDNSTAVPNNTIAPPELRLQQKASKTAEKQAKKPKRRSESSSVSPIHLTFSVFKNRIQQIGSYLTIFRFPSSFDERSLGN